MRVSLFVTCLVDQFWPSVGVATVKLLRQAGCEVHFDERQTCCGQPAFNSGFRTDARAVAQHTIEVLESGSPDAIVMPSGSCCAMTKHWHTLFEDEPEWRARGEAIAARTHELSRFLVHTLGVRELGARFDGRVAWHDACHGLRELGIKDEPRALIAEVQGAELVEVAHHDQCCGFGGTFSVHYPEISVAMLDRKLDTLEEEGVRAVVSGDVSCLMQIGGRLERRDSKMRAMHLAELLTGSA